MRAGWGLVGALVLAGCVAGPAAPGKVAQVNAPALADMLPDASALPPGFHVGYETTPGDPTRLFRAYDDAGNDANARHALRITIMRAATFELAQAQFDQLRAPGSPDVVVRDEGDVATMTQTLGDPPAGWIVAAAGHRGLHVAWVLEQAEGEPPVTNVTQIARGILARAPAGP